MPFVGLITGGLTNLLTRKVAVTIGALVGVFLVGLGTRELFRLIWRAYRSYMKERIRTAIPFKKP